MRLQLKRGAQQFGAAGVELGAQRAVGPGQLEAEIAQADPGRRGLDRDVAAQLELLHAAAPAAQALRRGAERRCPASAAGPACAWLRRLAGVFCSDSTQAGGSDFESARSSRLCADSVPFNCSCSVSAEGAAHGQLLQFDLRRPAARRPACPAASAPWRFAQLAGPSCRALASSGPSVLRAGQRPRTCALALSVPASRASAPASCSRRSSGCRRFSVGISAFRSQRSAAPSSRLPSCASASRLLPSASSCSLASGLAVRRGLQRQVAAQRHAGQAAGLQVRAWRGRAAAPAAAGSSGAAAGRARSKSRARVEAVRPLAPGRILAARATRAAGRSRAAWPGRARPSRRVRRARQLRIAAWRGRSPACASSSRSSMRSALSRASSRSCTGCAGPRSSSWPSRLPRLHRRACGPPLGAAAAVEAAAVEPQLAVQPHGRRARVQQRRAQRADSGVSSCQVAGFQCPLPLRRPAAALRPCPARRRRRVSSSWLGSSGRALQLELQRRAAAAALRSSGRRRGCSAVSATAAGWSRAWVLAEASRSSAVRGASLCSADRSSARALACSVAQRPGGERDAAWRWHPASAPAAAAPAARAA